MPYPIIDGVRTCRVDATLAQNRGTTSFHISEADGMHTVSHGTANGGANRVCPEPGWVNGCGRRREITALTQPFQGSLGLNRHQERCLSNYLRSMRTTRNTTNPQTAGAATVSDMYEFSKVEICFETEQGEQKVVIFE